MSTLASSFGQRRQSGTQRSSAGAQLNALTARMRKLSDICLFVAILVVPMTSASVQEGGIALFVICSLSMGLLWAIEQILEAPVGSAATGAEIIAFAAVALVCFQLMPLPTAVLKHVATFSAEYLSLWGTPEGRIIGDSPWTSVTLTPSLTRSGLILLIAYVVFFLTLQQRLRSVADIDRILKIIAAATAIMAVLGVAQLVLGSKQFLWMFEHPFRTAAWPAKGAFSNQNHFAHFLALGIGPLIWWWKDSTPRQETVVRGSVQASGFGVRRSTESWRNIVGVAIGIVLLAGILSFSRGGIIAIAIASLVSVRIVYRQWKHLLRMAIPVGTFILIAVWLFGTEYIQQRFQSLQNAGSIQEALGGRFALWSAISEAVPSFHLAGSGLGSHAEVYPTWLDEDFGVRFSHAESGYLQVLLELGAIGISLLGAGLLLIMLWIRRAWQQCDEDNRSRVTVLAAGVLVSLLHSVVDFVWYIPGCMIVTLVIVACLCRLQQLSRVSATSDVTPVPNRWPGILAWSIVLAIVPVGRLAADVSIRDAATEEDWNRYRKHAIAANDASSYESMESLDDQLDTIIMYLEACVERDPQDFRAASDLAAMYLRRFERHQLHSDNKVNVREIRDTVHSVGFESNQELASWLKRAFGEDAADLYRALTMARRAVRGQPARGETYLVLAQVGFLAGITQEEEQALQDQAVRLRPHKAAVLFVTGLTYAENGDLDSAMREWRKAFQRDKSIRRMIVQGIVPHLSADEVISHLNPDADGLWLLFVEYRNRKQSTDVDFVVESYLNRFAEFAESPDRGRFFWRQSFDFFEHAGYDKKATACLVKAVGDSPLDYGLRKSLALRLLKEQANEDAGRHLEWCLARQPDDREIAEALSNLRSKYSDEAGHEK